MTVQRKTRKRGIHETPTILDSTNNCLFPSHSIQYKNYESKIGINNMKDNNYNSGHRNSGRFNSGDYNSGDLNSGYRNSGDYNSRYYNSGNYNSGDYNSGDYNSGNRNSGIFNTNEPKMRFFNKDSNYTMSEFLKNNNMIYPDLHTCKWIYENDMTDEEKENISEWEIMGGYLKTMDYKEAWSEYWGRASESDKQWFQNLPNFDADIFLEITGVDVHKKEETIEIEGKQYTVSEIKKALNESKR